MAALTAFGCRIALTTALGCTTSLDPSVLLGAGGEGGALPACARSTRAPSDYLICPAPLEFGEATADCLARDAKLATIGSEAEGEFVAASAAGVASDDLWLGATRDDSFVWRWMDNTVFWRGGPDGAAEGDAFTNWLPGEPNDSSTVTTDPERCLALKFNQTDWYDRACSLRLPYACEQPTP